MPQAPDTLDSKYFGTVLWQMISIVAYVSGLWPAFSLQVAGHHKNLTQRQMNSAVKNEGDFCVGLRSWFVMVGAAA